MNMPFGMEVKHATKGRLERVEGENLHDIKSIAGSLFHGKNILSVCVFDALGTPCLYLKKNPDGTFVREENESPLALF